MSGALPATIVGNLAASAARTPDAPLIIGTDGVTTTYRGFAELVEETAAALRAAGLGPGDRLVACLPNGLEIAVLIWACARAGVLFAGIPTTLPRTAREALAAHTEPALVLTTDGADLPGARPVAEVVTGARRPWDAEAPLPDAEAPYAVIFTSGTTGLPKGALVTHRQTMAVAAFYRDLLALTERDVTAIHLSFAYLSGHISQLNPMIAAGASAVLLDGFDAHRVVEAAERHRVTVLDVVPVMFEALLRDPGFTGEHLPALRAAIFGGSRMPASTRAAVRRRVPALALHDVYGMTETAGLIAALPDTEADAHPGTVGRPVAGVRVAIGEDGELLVAGPTVTPGYLGNPAASAELLVGGMLHTGDSARLDDDGYLVVGDRLRLMINRGGAKIAPADVEAALLVHPAVAEAAAYGVPSASAAAGEDVAVAVVLRSTVTTDDLRAWARERLPVAARPRHVHVVAAIPRNATGKVDRAALLALG